MQNDIFGSEIGSEFGEPGGTPPPRIPRIVGDVFLSCTRFCADVYIIDIIRWRDVITKLEGNDLACFKINRKDGSHFIDPVSPSTCVWIRGFKDFHVRRRIRIQIEFARAYVSGFTLSSFANLKSDLRLMRKFYCRALFR